MDTPRKESLQDYYEHVRDLDGAEREADKARNAFPLPVPHDRLNGATLLLPPCGCTVMGRGTIPFPVRIAYCERHREVKDPTICIRCSKAPPGKDGLHCDACQAIVAKAYVANAALLPARGEIRATSRKESIYTSPRRLGSQKPGDGLR